MGLFNWAAPIFGHFADRWTSEDIELIAGWLRPHIGHGGELLDVGGGTGALASKLGDALGVRATVLDPTPQMLRYAPESDALRTVLGSAESMPFGTDRFDALVVTDAFHHFRDQDSAVREFARVVRPGGCVLILDLDPRGFFMGLIVIGEKLLGEPAGFFTPDGLCDYLASRGIRGECTPGRGPSYRYLGVVESGPPS